MELHERTAKSSDQIVWETVDFVRERSPHVTLDETTTIISVVWGHQRTSSYDREYRVSTILNVMVVGMRIKHGYGHRPKQRKQ